MNRPDARHAGPRRRPSWWRGPVLPSVLLAIASALLIWELTWAVPLLTGG